MEEYLNFLGGDDPSPRHNEQHEQVPRDFLQISTSEGISAVAQGTCATSGLMNNNTSSTCSKEDDVSNNVSNNKVPDKGSDLGVVVHVVQEIVSECEGCGRAFSDGVDCDDVVKRGVTLPGFCVECCLI
jgi:hypothetical protein